MCGHGPNLQSQKNTTKSVVAHVSLNTDCNTEKLCGELDQTAHTAKGPTKIIDHSGD